jgi:hypothetical protein
VVIEDDKPECTDAEDETDSASDDVDASSAEREASPSTTLLSQATTSDLPKPISPADFEWWYDVEAGCFVNEEML